MELPDVQVKETTSSPWQRRMSLQTSRYFTQHREMRSRVLQSTSRDAARTNAARLNVFGSNPSKLSDYFGYGRPIFAVGDGGAFQDGTIGDPTKYSEEFFAKLMAEFVPKGHRSRCVRQLRRH